MTCLKPMSKPVYLIDASIFIFKSYFALPDAWINEQGYSLNAVLGYTQFLIRFLERTQPDYVAAAFDTSLGQGFRHQLYDGYKASRALPDEALAFQLDACQRVSELLGISGYASTEFEADDLIASLAKRLRRTRRSMCIVSRDKDLTQLLSHPGDDLWDASSNIAMDASGVQAKFGVAPSQMVDFLSLVGDSIDDIPGVAGIGAKTAASLLQRFVSVDAMLADLPAVCASGLRGAKRLSESLDEHRQQLDLARQLVALRSDVAVIGAAKELAWRPVERVPLVDYLQEIGLSGQIYRTIQQASIFK